MIATVVTAPIWAVIWLVALYGQNWGAADLAGRAILMLTAGIAAAINVTAGIPRVRLVRATNSQARRVHNLLVVCATCQLTVHVARAFLAIQAHGSFPALHDGIDLLLVPFQTAMYLLLATYWSSFAAVAQPRASAIRVAAPRTAADREDVADSPSPQVPQTNNVATANRPPDDAGARGISDLSKSSAGESGNGAKPPYATAEATGDQRHTRLPKGRARRRAALRCALGVAVLIAAMTALSSPAVEIPTLICHSAAATDLNISQEHLLSARASPRASAQQQGIGRSAEETQKAPPASPAAGGRRNGASRAPPR